MYKITTICIVSTLFLAMLGMEPAPKRQKLDVSAVSYFTRLPQDIQLEILIASLPKDTLVHDALQRLLTLRFVNNSFAHSITKSWLTSDHTIKRLAQHFNVTPRAIALHIIRMLHLNAQDALTLLAKHPADDRLNQALFDAIDSNQLDTVYDLLLCNANVNAHAMEMFKNNEEGDHDEYHGASALMLAVESRNSDIVKALLNFGADFDLQNAFDETALIKAIIKYTGDTASADIIKVLLKAGANTEIRDNEGQTALSYAIKYGSREIVVMLLQAKAKVNTMATLGYTPLMYAIYYGSADLVKLLLEYGADVNAQGNSKQTALIYALSRCQAQDTIEMLINAGADINAQDILGKTALMYAASHQDTATVTLLLSRGARLDIKDNAGETALMHAYAHAGYHDIANIHAITVTDILIAHGASFYD